MSASRGLSTVLDVALCVLLVGGAVVALSTVVPDAHPDTVADATPTDTARAVLASTARVEVRNATVEGPVASLLADAAVADGRRGDAVYAAVVETAARRRLVNTSRRASLTASWRPDRPCRPVTLAVGATPPTGASVDAVTLPVPTDASACGDAPVRLTLRTWSP